MSSASEPMRELVEKLRDRRKRLGLSQIDADRAVGCAKGLVAKWECDDRTPSLPSLVNWATGLEGYLVITGTPIPNGLHDTEQIIIDIHRAGCEIEVVDRIAHGQNKILQEIINTRALIKKLLEVE